MCITGAPNVRPPKKKLITLDEVTHTHTAWHIFPWFMLDFLHIFFCLQHCPIQIECFCHLYICCLSHEECFRFCGRLPMPWQPIWRREKLNCERWRRRGRTGFRLKIKDRCGGDFKPSLSNTLNLSFPSLFIPDLHGSLFFQYSQD